jgi:hypothetical protein
MKNIIIFENRDKEFSSKIYLQQNQPEIKKIFFSNCPPYLLTIWWFYFRPEAPNPLYTSFMSEDYRTNCTLEMQLFCKIIIYEIICSYSLFCRFYDYWEVTKQNCKTGKPQKYIVLVTELMTSGNCCTLSLSAWLCAADLYCGMPPPPAVCFPKIILFPLPFLTADFCAPSTFFLYSAAFSVFFPLSSPLHPLHFSLLLFTLFLKMAS